MVYKFLHKFFAQVTIFVIVFIFFGRLFFPPSTYVNPDFGQTDILHIFLPGKFILSNSLKEFRLPVWESHVGQGYPIYAEPLGTFYLLNLLIFFILPFKLAVPSLNFATFLIAAYGMYFLLIKLKLSKPVSIMGAISFAFSAAMILRVQHLAIAQAIALLPWTLNFFQNFFERKKLKDLIITSFFFSQMLFAFPQIFAYAILLFFLIGIIHALFEEKGKVKLFLFSFTILLIFTLALSAIQSLPTYELLRQSQRTEGVDPNLILTAFPLLPKNFVTFFDPFILGKASNGTYNSNDWAKNGIFWENTSYIGLLPLFFSLFAIIYLVLKRPKNFFSYVAIATFVSLLMALGKYAPTHIFFSFPPLHYFRVPARFIMFTQFFLVILSAYGANKIITYLSKGYQKIFFALIILVTIVDLFTKWWNYNPIGKIDEWFKEPEITVELDKNKSGDYRIYSIGSNISWNDIFLKYGWENKMDYYKFFLNSLEPNTNLYYDLNHLSSYQVLPTRRQTLQQSIIPNGTRITQDQIEFNEAATKALNLFGVKYLITTLPIKNDGYQKLYEINKDKYNFILYENNNAQNLINLYYEYSEVKTLNDYQVAFRDEDPAKTVFLENPPKRSFEKGASSILIIKKNNSYVSLDVTSSTDGILIYSDSYYPGWEAKIDSKITKIYPANINSKAVIVPAGKHTVEFLYRPKSILIGGIITIFSLLVSVFILIKQKS